MRIVKRDYQDDYNSEATQYVSQGDCNSDARQVASQGDRHRQGRPYPTRIRPYPSYRVGATLAVALIFAFSLLACDGPTINFGATATPTLTGLPGNAQLNTWYPAAHGIDVRYEDWKASDGTDDDTVTIVRVNPHDVTLSVGYQPDKPLLMS